MERNDEIDKILGLLSQNEIIIYGAGNVGERFLDVLKQHGIISNVLCFVESVYNENKREVEGIPVRPIEEAYNRKDAIICIAVHDVWKDEIIQILNQRNVDNYLWIYPFLHELMIGSPVETCVEVEINKIISCVENYNIAIRYMVLEQYWGKGNTGYDIYVRAMMLQCGGKTAERRLKKFCELIHNWSENGIDENSQIMLNTQYKIIDGNHRIATAKYFGQEKIKCNIYSSNLSLEKLYGEKCAVWTEKVLRDGGFSEEEIRVIDAKNKYIKGE